MKKINIVITTLASLFIMLSSQPTYSATMVRLEVSPLISVGDTFSLGIYVDGLTGTDPFWGMDAILAFGFDVVSNPDFIYNGATVGAAFDDVSPLLSSTDVAGMAFPGACGTNIELAQLSFTATTAGDFLVGIASDLADPNEGLYTWLGGLPMDVSSITNVTVASVPAPESVVLVGMLVGIGMIGFFNYKEKEGTPISNA